jgi:hypothetical protein
MKRDRLTTSLAQPHETEEVLALVEELLAELGEEGEESARIDKERLRAAAPLPKNDSTERGRAS